MKQKGVSIEKLALDLNLSEEEAIGIVIIYLRLISKF